MHMHLRACPLQKSSLPQAGCGQHAKSRILERVAASPSPVAWVQGSPNAGDFDLLTSKEHDYGYDYLSIEDYAGEPCCCRAVHDAP